MSALASSWIQDARSEDLLFRIDVLDGSRYRTLRADRQGWLRSPVFGLRVRLTRSLNAYSRWQYRLEHGS